MFTLSGACGSACPRDDAAIITSVLHEFAESLGAAVDAKDRHTRQHSEEVAVVAHALALGLGLGADQADIIHVAAHLHDVGKIGIPDAVLGKPGPLDDGEFALIRRHPVIGAEIVRPVRVLRECGIMDMVLHHHERFDGKGYPVGLRGGAIPRGARIIAVADSLSAMLQKRPYRAAMDFEEAAAELEAGAGSQFDPLVVRAFLNARVTIRELLLCMRTEADAPAPSAVDAACEPAATETGGR